MAKINLLIFESILRQYYLIAKSTHRLKSVKLESIYNNSSAKIIIILNMETKRRYRRKTGYRIRKYSRPVRVVRPIAQNEIRFTVEKLA